MGSGNHGGPAMNWWQDIFGAFKASGGAMVGTCARAGHNALIEACVAAGEIRAVPLTSEADGMPLKNCFRRALLGAEAII
jgi:hypothetical protein